MGFVGEWGGGGGAYIFTAVGLIMANIGRHVLGCMTKTNARRCIPHVKQGKGETGVIWVIPIPISEKYRVHDVHRCFYIQKSKCDMQLYALIIGNEYSSLDKIVSFLVLKIIVSIKSELVYW